MRNEKKERVIQGEVALDLGDLLLDIVAFPREA